MKNIRGSITDNKIMVISNFPSASRNRNLYQLKPPIKAFFFSRENHQDYTLPWMFQNHQGLKGYTFPWMLNSYIEDKDEARLFMAKRKYCCMHRRTMFQAMFC